VKALEKLQLHLARVDVKPHVRKVNGKLVKVKGHKRILDLIFNHEVTTKPGLEVHRINAHDKDGKLAGYILWANFPDPPSKQYYPNVKEIGVHPDRRRQGLGTELWTRARAITPDLRHSSTQTPEGKAWAAAVDAMAPEQLATNKTEDDDIPEYLRPLDLNDPKTFEGMKTKGAEVFVPCPRCDGEGGKKWWPMFTCFRCDGNKGEWEDKKAYVTKENRRRKAELKRMENADAKYEALVKKRDAAMAAFIKRHPKEGEWLANYVAIGSGDPPTDGGATGSSAAWDHYRAGKGAQMLYFDLHKTEDKKTLERIGNVKRNLAEALNERNGILMEAKFPGRCKECGGKIAKGEQIRFKPGDGAYHPYHEDAFAPENLTLLKAPERVDDDIVLADGTTLRVKHSVVGNSHDLEVFAPDTPKTVEGEAYGRIGHMTWNEGFDPPQVLWAGLTAEEWERKGIATAMWQRARIQTPNLHHSDSLSDDAQAWIAKMQDAGIETPALNAFAPAHLTVLRAPVTPTDNIELPDGTVLTVEYDAGPPPRLSARHGGKRIAHLEWAKTHAGVPFVETVQTHSSRRGQGIATALWQRARLLEPDLRHSTLMSESAQIWDRKMNAAGIESPPFNPDLTFGPSQLGIDPKQMTEDEFLAHHYTGHIDSDAYTRFEDGDFGFIKRDRFDTLLETREVNGKTVEIRLQAEPLRYVKKTDAAPKEERDRLYAEFEAEAKRLGTDPMNASLDLGRDSKEFKALKVFEDRWRASGSDIIRDADGNATYLTDAEARAKGLPTIGYTVAAFVGDKAIGYAGDEFGASGVYVAKEYQRHGIGVTLLKTFLERSGRLEAGTRLGQMTPAGEGLTRALHRALLRDNPFAPDSLVILDKTEPENPTQPIVMPDGTVIPVTLRTSADTEGNVPPQFGLDEEWYELATAARGVKASLSWSKVRRDDGTEVWAVGIAVAKPQRQGLGTALWRRAKLITPDLVHSPDMSTKAQAWDKAMRSAGIESDRMETEGVDATPFLDEAFAPANLTLLEPPKSATEPITLADGTTLRVELKEVGGLKGLNAIATHPQLGDLEAGSLGWKHEGDIKYVAYVVSSHYDPLGKNYDFRRRGVATALWQRAKLIEPELRHSLNMSDDAYAWDKAMDEASIDSPNYPMDRVKNPLGNAAQAWEDQQARSDAFAPSQLRITPAPKTPTDDIPLDPKWAQRKQVADKLTVEHVTALYGGPATPYVHHTLVAKDAEGRRAAHIQWYEAPDDATEQALDTVYENMPYIGFVGTETRYQRQGVATALWQRARLVSPDLKHSSIISKRAQSWDRSMEAAGIDSPNVDDPTVEDPKLAEAREHSGAHVHGYPVSRDGNVHVFHGTGSKDTVASIRSEGLRPSRQKELPNVTTDLERAAQYTPFRGGHVLEYSIPADKVSDFLEVGEAFIGGIGGAVSKPIPYTYVVSVRRTRHAKVV
jgi:GNAT superfamily N-acetyltransferase